MAIVDLPQPDSPARPRVWPGSRLRFTPRTAGTGPPSVAYVTDRSRSSSSVTGAPNVAMPSALPQLRVEHGLERVTDESERHHHENDRDAGGEQPEQVAGADPVAVGAAQHLAP